MNIEKLTEIAVNTAREAAQVKVNDAYRRGCEDTRYLLELDDDNFERKPFYSDFYKPGMTVKTRDGRDVRILCTDADTKTDRTVVALIKTDDGELVKQYYFDGKVNVNGVECNDDLVIINKKNIGYVNVNITPHGDYQLGSQEIYKTHQEAYDNRVINSGYGCYVCTAKIKWVDRSLISD